MKQFSKYKINKKILLLILISLLSISTNNVFAQKFVASVDKTTAGQNERFQVYFEFSDGDNNKLRNFRPPTFVGLKVLSGPNQSTNMQIINGQMNSSITYSYIVTGSDIGDFTIGSASIMHGNTEFKTDPINIKIVKGNVQAQQGQSGDANISQEDIAKNLFIVAEVDKRSAYKGEQLTVTYKLYTRLEISSPQINKLPQYKGFWAEELDPIKNLNFQIEMYEGQRFRSALLKKVALFPTKSGDLSITPFELTIPVIIKRRRSGRDVFDDFFNDSFFGRRETVEFVARSNNVKVNIKELPANDRPESFNGAVGDFKFSTSLDKTEVEANEPITLKVNISGTGNIKLLDVPKLKLPAGFEQYDPKTSENINRRGRVNGNKSAEYLLVPRVPGKKEIPPVEFSYFNPRIGKYITETSPSYLLNVVRGESIAQTTTSGFSKEDVKLLSEDIRFIKTSDFNWQKRENDNLIKSWFWITLIIPFIAFVTFIGIRKRQDKLSGNVQLMKYQKAEKNARTRLKSAKKALDSKNIAEFHTEISNAITGYLEDKLHIQKSEFTRDKAVKTLGENGVDSDLIKKVEEILDKCEFVRFAPQMSSESESGELHEATVKLIIDLESSILIRK
jgi:hypothetical protein